MSEAYFNVPASAYSGSGDTGVFRWNKNDATGKLCDLTVTVGPDATLPRYGLSDNKNCVKVIFEYAGAEDRQVENNAFLRTGNLHTVVCKGTEGLMWARVDATLGANVGGTKYLVVPDGFKDKYMNHAIDDSLYKGFVIKCGFQLIEQSDYIE